jgi:hypothetical protein
MASWRSWLCLTALGALACGGVRAQLLADYFPEGVPGYGTAPGVTVASRERPDYDPQGVRVDSFVLHPGIDESLGYDSNLLGGANGLGSWVIGTRPSLLVNSDWSRDSLGGYFGLDDERYVSQPAQSFTNWTASLGGTVAVGRDALTISVAHFSLHQARTDLDALPTDTPVAYQVDDARANYLATFGRLSISPGVAFSSYRYDATTEFGVPTPQAYRNRDVVQGEVTTRYELSPDRNALLVTRVLNSNYVAPQAGQPTRNSTGYQVLLGLSDDSDGVWRYRVLVGWEDRVFQASAYKAHQAPIAEAALIWAPSEVTTVTARLTRSIEDAAQDGVVGYTYTAARLVVDHELLRNVMLQGYAGVQQANFLQGGGTSNGVSLGGGVTWLVNRNVRVAATYDFTDQHGSNSPTVQTSGSFTRNIGLLTLRLGM